MFIYFAVCLVFLACAGSSVCISNELNDSHNIFCQPVPSVVRVDGANSLPYFVTLYRCHGSVKGHVPSKKECVANTSTVINVKFGPGKVTMKNHTSCKGQCLYPKECTEDLFNRDETDCSCTCKHDKAPKGKPCRPNERWNKNTCKCDCTLTDSDETHKKKLDKKQCKLVCKRSRKCRSGYTLNDDTCGCTRTKADQKAVAGREGSDGMSQGELLTAVIIGEFVVLYLIFDFILWQKKTGLAYNIWDKCLRGPRQHAQNGRDRTHDRQENGGDNSTTVRLTVDENGTPKSNQSGGKHVSAV